VFYGNGAVATRKYYGTASRTSFGIGFKISCGDYNGVGYDDLLWGDYEASSSDGIGYIAFGSSIGLPSSPDVTITAPSKSFSIGQWFATKHKFNVNGATKSGKSLDSFAIMTRSWNGSKYMSNEVRIFYGKADWTGITNIDANNPDVLFTAPLTYTSGAVATGDVNGDGYADLIVGQSGVTGIPGIAYIVYGGPSLPSTITPSYAGVATVSNGTYLNFGLIATVGDVQGLGTNTGSLFMQDYGSGVRPYAGKKNEVGVDNKVAFKYGTTFFGSSMDVFSYNADRRAVVVNDSGKMHMFSNSTLDFTNNSGYVTVVEPDVAVTAAYMLARVPDWNGDGFEDILFCNSTGSGVAYMLK
jgi:hypothetical protein